MKIARPIRLEGAVLWILAALSIPASASAGCTISTSPINFGVYPVIAGAVVSSVGAISYTCAGPVPAGIKIAIGPGRYGTVERRAMAGGISKLPYVLSLDPHGFAPWGDGSMGTQVYYDPHPPRNQTVTIRVYGLIAPGQRIEPNQVFRDNVSVVAFY